MAVRIGINGFGAFLGRNDASTENYAAHLEYALELVGEDHVGIGLDYVYDQRELEQFIAGDPETFPPAHYPRNVNMVEPWRLPAIASFLIDRGHSTDVLGKLLGGNFERIARQVWR